MIPPSISWALSIPQVVSWTRSYSRMDARLRFCVLYDGRNDYGQVAACSVLDSREDLLPRWKWMAFVRRRDFGVAPGAYP